jgi:hypothetical protein
MKSKDVVLVRITNDASPEQLREFESNPEYRKALAYLISWGNSDFVSIAIESDGDIYASHYRMIDGQEMDRDMIDLSRMKRVIFIAGIYDAKTKTYSFHS